jgi:hypothetical protein
VTRKLTPGLPADEAWEDVLALLAWEPLPIGRDVILRGRAVARRYRLSWWDSLIVAGAQLQNCELLLSEDLRHGLVCDTVRVCNPFVEQMAEATAAYAIAPQRVSRHRARGRPKRVVAPAV